MFSNYLLAIASIYFASLVLTQTNTTTLDPNSVSLTLRSQWCQGQINTCGILCSGDSNLNSCDPSTLLYTCTCTANNSSPDLADYKETLPTFICETLFSNCISAAAGNASAQADCQTNIEDHCGKLDPNSFDDGFSQGAPVSSSSTGSTSQKSTTTTIPLSTPTTSQYRSTSSSSQPSSTSILATTSTPSPSPSKTPPHTQDPANIPTSTPTSASTFPPSISSTSHPTPLQLGPGLTQAQKAGIAIGSVIGVILLCTSIYIFIRRRRKKREVEGEGYPSVPELSTNGILEIPQLETKERPGELSADVLARRYELG